MDDIMDTINKLDTLYEKATKGEWAYIANNVSDPGIPNSIEASSRTVIGDEEYGYAVMSDDDAEWITASHNAYPLLRERFLALQKAASDLRERYLKDGKDFPLPTELAFAALFEQLPTDKEEGNNV